MADLAGRRILVVGASSGIGRATTPRGSVLSFDPGAVA